MLKCLRASTAVLASLLAGLSAGAAGARAQACSVTVTAMNFGTINRTRGPTDTTAALTASCTGQGQQIIQLCPQLTANTGTLPGGQLAHVSDPTQQMRVAFYADPSHTIAWRDGINVTLNASGSGSERRTVYGRMFPARGVKGGRYQASLAMTFIATYAHTGPACTSSSPVPLASVPKANVRLPINHRF